MAEVFKDRRAELFGREKDVHYLAERARKCGVTAVVAPPLSGKTWTLDEVARRLTEEGKYLVGYHESKGDEHSHMLHAVSNLYTNWLSDSTMRGQALSLWETHKEDLVPRIGTMVGTLFAKCGLSAGIGAIVSASFKGLEEAHKTLLNGGLELPPLTYKEALSLTKLVAKISKCHVVLILDAWEKALSIRSDSALFERFLKHQDDWPDTHIFLAICNPDADSTNINDEAYKRAHDLRRRSPVATVYGLPPIALQTSTESIRIVNYLHDNIYATNNVNDQELLKMIDGFPGVLHFWRKSSDRNELKTKEDLVQLASNAQALRYAEFDHLLKGLPEAPKNLYAFAARLAFFPRLTDEKWKIFRKFLADDILDTDIDKLIDGKVFENVENDCFPTYGHDTRQAAARQWLVENSGRIIRSASESLIEILASHLTVESTPLNRPIVEALAACHESARQVKVNPTLCCLIDAARSVVGDTDHIFRQSFDETYPKALQRNAAFVNLISAALFLRGTVKFGREDHDGAIADFTAVNYLPNVPDMVAASVLYFRGCLNYQRGDNDGAIADFDAAMERPNLPAAVAAPVILYRAIVKSQRGDRDGAVIDFAQALEDQSALDSLLQAAKHLPAAFVAPLLFCRAIGKCQRGDHDGAVIDLTQALEDQSALDSLLQAAEHLPAALVAPMLLLRGSAKVQRGDHDGAIADYTTVIELPNAPVEAAAKARFFRGVARVMHGDGDGFTDLADGSASLDALAYYLVKQSGTGPSGILSTTLVLRGVAKYQRGNHDGAIADTTAVIELPNAPVEAAALALVIRGVAKYQRGDNDGAIADFTAAIELPNAPDELPAVALVIRGAVKYLRGDNDGTITDSTAAIELPNASAEEAAQALFVRGVAKSQRGDFDGASADFTAAIELPNAPAKLAAQPLVYRGVEKYRRGDNDGAISDCTAAIELPNAPDELAALALFVRGAAKFLRGDHDSTTDVTAAIASPDALAYIVETVQKKLNLPAKKVVRPAISVRVVVAESRRDDNGGVVTCTLTYGFTFTFAIDLPDLPTYIVEMIRARVPKTMSSTEPAQ